MTTDDAGDVPTLTMEDVIYWMGWHMDSQRRIYDLLLSLFAVENAARAKELQQMHESGKFLYPPHNYGAEQ